MTYAPVIPTTWDPSRQALNDMLNAIIAGFQAAVPNVIRKQWSEIPASFTGEVPLIYLGAIRETIRHSGGVVPNGSSIRQTVFEGEIGYVDVSPDNQEANTRANSFADYMREVFTANARISVGATGTTGIDGIFQQISITEGDTSQGPLKGFMHLVAGYIYVVLEGRN